MSSWGTGVSQSDEFADIYEDFFEAYTGDADPFDIQKKIWKEYTEEFPEEKDTPILYTVRYALAQCLWECGKRDEALWEEIDEIIHSGKELRFWGALSEQNPKLQRQRQRSLEQFWTKINSEPKRIRKPKKNTEKRLPTLHKGNVFAYAVPEGGFRAAVVFDFVWNSFLFAVTDAVFPEVPSLETVWDSQTSLVFWGDQRAAIPKKNRIPIGTYSISGDYNGRAGLLYTEKIVGCTSVADRSYFFASETAKADMGRNRIKTYQMKELLDPKRLPSAWPKGYGTYERYQYERKRKNQHE